VPVPITTRRLVLRAFTPDDVSEIHAHLYSDATAMRFIGGPHTLQRTRQGIETYIAQQRRSGFSFWAVLERETGSIVGEAGLYPFNAVGPEVELGYALGTPWWGRGYATEVGEALLAEAFGPLGLERVVAVVKPDNARSQRVLVRLGFRAEGERQAWGAPHLLFVRDRGPAEEGEAGDAPAA